MSVKHGILGILAGRPRHGYELKTEFDSLTAGLWDLNIGQIYSTLDRMLKDGLVALHEDDPDASAADRKIYRITDEGVQELDLWLARPPLKARPMRDELYVRLGLLLDRNPAAALDLLEGQRRIYHLQMAELTRQKIQAARSAEPDRTRRELMLDAALLHVDADLKWLENCAGRLMP